MKLSNIGGFQKIEDFISWKLQNFEKEEKSFSTLFRYMFSESENIMAEFSDGYRVTKVTYGEFKEQVRKKAVALRGFFDFPAGSIVGMYMDNSLDWIRVFWAILMCGYRPLLLNMRLSEGILEEVLHNYSVKAVVSDEKIFTVKTVIARDLTDGEGHDNGFDGAWGEEVIFMSSGTTENIKLCAYTAENFYYQVGNSVDIVNKCPEISNHYEGELKILTLLPFYHVFGFIAVYLWFGFFSRTFVFLKDMNPKTIQNTVKKHKVTHIFSVPLVWKLVYKSAMRTIRARGDKSYKKFIKGIKLANSGAFGRKITYKAMGEVRENLFGDSIQFLISGGGEISSDILEFYNGIGYHLTNGYGMTEVGITSVEVSKSAKERNLCSIGAPFEYTEYSVSRNGTLLIKGKNMASRICCNGEEKKTDFSEWFDSNDLAEERCGKYFLHGRRDDLIVSVSGENLNPQLIEKNLNIRLADEICLINAKNKPTLLIKSSSCYSEDKIREIITQAKKELERLGLDREIRNISVTPDKFITEGEFKLNRRKIAARFLNGEILSIDASSVKESVANLVDELERQIQKIFADVLNKDITEIGVNANFFGDLGGSSLDYFMLADAISAVYGVDIKTVNGKSLHTIADICAAIKNH